MTIPGTFWDWALWETLGIWALQGDSGVGHSRERVCGHSRETLELGIVGKLWGLGLGTLGRYWGWIFYSGFGHSGIRNRSGETRRRIEFNPFRGGKKEMIIFLGISRFHRDYYTTLGHMDIQEKFMNLCPAEPFSFGNNINENTTNIFLIAIYGIYYINHSNTIMKENILFLYKYE